MQGKTVIMMVMRPVLLRHVLGMLRESLRYGHVVHSSRD
jgi:hypothetical protein